MKAIGGYFELELGNTADLYPHLIKVNSGRNAFRYILEAQNYSKVYLPYFTCKAVAEVAKRCKIDIGYYSINENFEPIFDFSIIESSEAFLYTNYFGLKDDYVIQLSRQNINVIIDNAQALFSKLVPEINTFYSPRKFVGVPDGGYLFCKKQLNFELEKDESYSRAAHLLKRIDMSAEFGYADYLENEKEISALPLKKMSFLTQKILGAIDYKKVSAVRRDNYEFLSQQLGRINKVKFELQSSAVPLSYPFYTDDENLRLKLINNSIYTSQYWNEVISEMPADSLEHTYAINLIHLPVDQRYTKVDLQRVVDAVTKNARNA